MKKKKALYQYDTKLKSTQKIILDIENGIDGDGHFGNGEHDKPGLPDGSGGSFSSTAYYEQYFTI